MDAFVARQPILDRKQRLFAYELLLRDGLNGFCPDMDGDVATSQLLSNSFLTIGMENLSGNKRAFINFTQELLLKRLPLMFPADKIVVEILEDVEPTPDIVTACKEIADKGYLIALDDFLYQPELEPLVALADIIKIDFKLSSKEEMTKTLQDLAVYEPKLLAEKVETPAEFQVALDLGFDYFQGYFFKKPQVVSQKDIVSNQLHLLQIVSEANKREADFDKLEELISRDVAIPYKLLRYINSAFFRRTKEIASIKQAITRLGLNETRSFLSLMAMTKLAPDKPNELIRSSIVRAKFCELLAKLGTKKIKPAVLFMLGLFSMIDAIMDDSMESCMEKLPFSEDIRQALLDGEGPLGPYLALVRAYEKGAWSAVSEIADQLGLNGKTLPQCYVQALVWSDQFMHL